MGPKSLTETLTLNSWLIETNPELQPIMPLMLLLRQTPDGRSGRSPVLRTVIVALQLAIVTPLITALILKEIVFVFVGC